jgi:hypothetical protein
MPIASIGVLLTVTPQDEIQIVRGKGDYEFVDDRTPFKMKVSEVLYDDNSLIGVAGPIISGHQRYGGLFATLTTRIDGSRWETDMRSGAGFIAGSSIGRRIREFPHYHPHGMEVDGYPFIVRYGGVDAET